MVALAARWRIVHCRPDAIWRNLPCHASYACNGRHNARCEACTSAWRGLAVVAESANVKKSEVHLCSRHDQTGERRRQHVTCCVRVSDTTELVCQFCCAYEGIPQIVRNSGRCIYYIHMFSIATHRACRCRIRRA